MSLVRPYYITFYVITIIVQPIFEKKGYKKIIIRAFSVSGFEIIFTLLAKTVTILMKVTLVEIWKTSPKGLFLRFCQSWDVGLALDEKV